MRLHKDLTGDDLHVNKLHAATHLPGGTDPLATLYFNVMDYGAHCDNNSDDLPAILATIAAAKAAYTGDIYSPDGSPVVYLPAGIGYRVTGTVTVPSGISFIQEAPILYDGSAEEACLVIGGTAVFNWNLRFRLWVSRNTVADWTNEANIGIKLINAYSCYIDIHHVKGFTIGAQCLGSAGGFAYNEVHLGYIVDNMVGVDCTNISSGWCNENVFIGGEFKRNSTTHAGLSNYGVRITSIDGSYLNNNNNIFLKPSFELIEATALPGHAYLVDVVHGLCNQFIYFRDELNASVVPNVLIENHSRFNVFEAGWAGQFGIADVADTSDSPTTFVRGVEQWMAQEASNIIFDSGAIAKKACYADGNATVHIPGLHRVSTSAVGTRTYAQAVSDFNAEYIELSTGGLALGVYINTTNAKRFIVRRDMVAPHYGRVLVACFDAAGTRLTDVGDTVHYVKGINTAYFYYTTSYGGSYKLGDDVAGDIYFVVTSAVYKVEVMLITGTDTLQLKSFQIEAIDNGDAACWSEFDTSLGTVNNYGSVAPTAGTWVAGRIVFNVAPTSAGYVGWVCTVGGTPGTWKGFGVIE